MRLYYATVFSSTSLVFEVLILDASKLCFARRIRSKKSREEYQSDFW